MVPSHQIVVKKESTGIVPLSANEVPVAVRVRLRWTLSVLHTSSPFPPTLSRTYFNLKMKNSSSVNALLSASCIESRGAASLKEKINGTCVLGTAYTSAFSNSNNTAGL